MDLSVLIARIISVIYLSAALGGFFSADHYRRLTRDLFENAALTFMMGFSAVIIGSLVVRYHNIWAWNWTVLITIIGWTALLRGVLIIAFPEYFRRLSRPFLTDRVMKIFPYVTLSIGLFFGYLGFVL